MRECFCDYNKNFKLNDAPCALKSYGKNGTSDTIINKHERRHISGNFDILFMKKSFPYYMFSDGFSLVHNAILFFFSNKSVIASEINFFRILIRNPTTPNFKMLFEKKLNRYINLKPFRVSKYINQIVKMFATEIFDNFVCKYKLELLKILFCLAG